MNNQQNLVNNAVTLMSLYSIYRSYSIVRRIRKQRDAMYTRIQLQDELANFMLDAIVNNPYRDEEFMRELAERVNFINIVNYMR